MLPNKKGFTLIEVLIAMVIILVVLLGLVQTAVLSIDNNLKNLLRDEAVRLAEEQMNVLKSLPINDVAYNPSANSFGLGAVTNQYIGTVTRKFGNFPGKYAVYLTINDLTTDHSRKSIQVYVGWNYRNEDPLQPITNTEYRYMITSIVATLQ